MKNVEHRTFWALLFAALAVFLGATAIGGWWDQPHWAAYLFGLAAGVCLSGCAFVCATVPEDDLVLEFRKGERPVIRIQHRGTEAQRKIYKGGSK